MNQSGANLGGSPASCRFCGEGLTNTFLDLGMSPLCEYFLSSIPNVAEIDSAETLR